ncbi:MAG: hypothetical protein AB7P76_12460 [Candidatus Melainabacteria bacterium]
MASEETPIQMKIVESPDSSMPNIQNAANKKRQKQLAEERDRNEIYRDAVRDAVSQLDQKILNQLESTEKELKATKEELLETRTSQNRLASTIDKQSQKSDALLEQNKRYQNTLDKLLPSITEMVINNKDPHVVYSSSEWATPDVVMTGGKIPTEVVYNYTAGILGQFVGINAARMGIIFRKFEIFNDPVYHHALPTGGRSVCHKYKLSALKEIYFRRNDPKYSDILKHYEIQQIQTFLQMKAKENAL